ncbi:hypothetical protein [Gordonia sp. (in: high G+C Gram-positive bacteria)]|mgnify:CR=1 FL=1|jgi:hypothetical protein|uniref:hypothetical protein n=1 Tax=Gordonia sp. (in: high G+C Gram-positive bacteria) TaxID=84139 RepID=UPI001DB2DF9B|nr:hypothetical protein [Gordonia sp. (in: high G+C Gram-positive bacteria)]MCB1294202.1 hypothetical protein [Gordonia sp. (in: high G+C Gram-positive bacteria)]HMS75886.1 hypothetical protein [Gordonia sp. (in: high G+C Gram-positive bacteria)]HQV16956.1 hypothetical protein [Gordonia sp. (in: high G+C Gram-positive bacteria)]
MLHGIPRIYWTFRYIWSAIHVSLVAIFAMWLTLYLVNDGRGEQLFDDWWIWAQDIHYQLANLIPFPWS